MARNPASLSVTRDIARAGHNNDASACRPEEKPHQVTGHAAGLSVVRPNVSDTSAFTEVGSNSLRYVVLPQALRNVLPDLVSNTIEVVKATSLASIVGVYDLLYSASTIRSVTFNTSALTLAAIIYLTILLPAVRLSGRLERRPKTL